MQHFLGGIYDGGSRGFIPVADAVVAIDIDSGSVLWRREQLGRPVAATGKRLVTLASQGKGFVLRLVDAATGADTGNIADFGMPKLAAEVGTAPDGVNIQADAMPEGLRLSWRLRRPYRGGAAPSTQVLDRMAVVERGAVMLDPMAATARPVAPPQNDISKSGAPVAAATSDPEIIAGDRIGDTVFALRARTVSKNIEVSLEALDTSDGRVLWRTELGRQAAARPGPLRK